MAVSLFGMDVAKWFSRKAKQDPSAKERQFLGTTCPFAHVLDIQPWRVLHYK